MFKKVLCLLLVLFIVPSLIAGCGSASDTPEATTAASVSTDATVPASTEKAPITITVPSFPKGAKPGSFMEKWLDDKFNVNLNVVALPSNGDDRKTQINLIMSDQKLMPDIIYFTDDNAKEFEQWKASGLLVDMYPLIAQYGQNIVQYYKKIDNDASALFSTFEDGKMYRLITDVSEPGSTTTIVRKDWMDKFGMTEIKTLDQYVDYLRKSVNNDPDGNGVKDTVGVSGFKEDMMAFYPFYSAFGVYPEEWFRQSDGSLKYGAVLPETKLALAAIRDAYKEGLIDPNLISGAKDFGGELYPDGKVASFYTWQFFLTPSFSPLTDFKTKNPGGDYVRIRPVSGPDGFSSDRPSDPFGSGYVAITSKCKDPAAAMRLLDGIVEPETSIFIKNGEEGVDYKMVDGDIQLLTSQDERDAKGIRIFTLLLERKDEYNIEIGKLGNANFADQQQTCMPLREKIAFLRNKARPVSNEKQADLNALYKTTFWSIITGEMPLDAFDNFVTEWYAHGGKEVTQETNEYWAKQKLEFDNFQKAFAKDMAK